MRLPKSMAIAAHDILIRSPPDRSVAEGAPGAYEDPGAVIDTVEAAGLTRKVARPVPRVRIKG